MPTPTRVVHAAVLLDFDGHQGLIHPHTDRRPGGPLSPRGQPWERAHNVGSRP